jgi:hypothetical protein
MFDDLAVVVNNVELTIGAVVKSEPPRERKSVHGIV